MHETTARDQEDDEGDRQSSDARETGAGGAYRGPIERLVTTPLDRALAFQVDLATTLLSGESQSTDATDSALATAVLASATETFATATRLPGEILSTGTNPFRHPVDDRPIEQRRELAGDSTTGTEIPPGDTSADNQTDSESGQQEDSSRAGT